MQQDESFRLPDDLNEFAQRLTSFEAHSPINIRDQILFEAGQTAARTALLADVSSLKRTLYAWQSVAVVLLAFSLGLGASLFLGREQPPQIAANERGQSVESPHTERTIEAAPYSTQEMTSLASPQDREKQDERIVERTTSEPRVLNEIIGLQARLASVEQMIEGLSISNLPQMNPEKTIEFACRGEPSSTLNPRTRLRGEGTQVLINRLIEEPNL